MSIPSLFATSERLDSPHWTVATSLSFDAAAKSRADVGPIVLPTLGGVMTLLVNAQFSDACGEQLLSGGNIFSKAMLAFMNRSLKDRWERLN